MQRPFLLRLVSPPRNIPNTSCSLLRLERNCRSQPLLFTARVFCSLWGHPVGTLTCWRALIMPLRRRRNKNRSHAAVSYFSASRGTPRTSPCEVNSVFERIIDANRHLQTKRCPLYTRFRRGTKRRLRSLPVLQVCQVGFRRISP